MNLRKKLIFIATSILIVCYVIGIVAAAILYNPPPHPPIASVTKLTAEPDYRITISWEKIPNAYAYEIEYKYELEPTKTLGVFTAKNYAKIDRIKGNLSFRIRTLYRNGKAQSDYSDMQTYYVQPLYLTQAPPATLQQYKEGVKFARQGWETVSYVYKGKPNYVNYYDCIAVGPGMDKDAEFEHKLNMQTIPAANIATNHFFPFGAGEWTVYYRPSYCYATLNREKLYSEELQKLYDETDVWTASTITVR